MRALFLPVLWALFFWSAVNLVAQDTLRDDNRDRALSVPSTRTLAGQNYGRGLGQAGRGKANPAAALPATQSSAVEAQADAPRSGVIKNPRAEGASDLVLAQKPVFAAQNPMPGKYVFDKADYKVGRLPNSIAMCDFNNDGIQDVAVGTITDFGISILLGKPDGTMSSATLITTTHPVQSVACGDFNGDGRIDIAATQDTDPLMIFPGKGDGTFGAPIQVSVPWFIRELQAVDLDGDGKLDLLFTEGLGLDALYGNGDGSFQPWVSYSVGNNFVGGFAVADLNGDKQLDLVVAVGPGVSVLIASGNRTFQPYVYYSTGTADATDVAVGDFNGDHKADLAALIGSNGPPSEVNSVAILKGAGDGTFSGLQLYPTGSSPSNLAVADLNGDNKLDVVTVNYYPRTFSVLLGNGDGSFQAHVDYGTGDTPILALGDFNGDGVPDVAIAADKLTNCYSNCQNGNLSIFLGNGTGLFSGSHYVTPDGASGLTATDMNGDGKPDLILGVDNNNDPATVAILLNKGDGSFAPPSQYTVGADVSGLTTGDFNRDRRQDVVVANPGGTISVLLGKGDGSLQLPAVYPAEAEPIFVLTADFNNDQKLDLVTVPYYQTNISVLLGNGDGSFQAHHEYASGFGGEAAFAADLNNDGNMDLVVTTLYSNPPTILLGKGDGTFQAPYTCDCGLYAPGAAIADFNTDGKLDIATGSLSGTITIAMGNGDGTFQPPVYYPASQFATQLALADVDGDGKTDIVAAGGSEVDVFYGNGDGTFRTFATYAQSLGNFSGFVVSDLTGSGSADLALSTYAIPPDSAYVSVFLNNPVIALHPSDFTFYPQVIGDTSLPGEFLISNPGSAPLKLSSIAIDGDFSQTNNCPEVLGVGANCTITATFTPTDLGLRTGKITLQDNALAGKQVIHLSGMAYALKISRTAVSFFAAKGKTDSRQVQLTNRGKTDIGINGLMLNGRDADQFSQMNDCGNTLPAYSSCTLTITFKPTTDGTKLAGVSIRDSDPSSPQQIVLRGVARK